MASIAQAAAPEVPEDAEMHAALPRVRVLAESATARERKAANRTWPPVERGQFVLFDDGLDASEYIQSSCEIVLAVRDDAALICLEAGCPSPDLVSRGRRARQETVQSVRARALNLPEQTCGLCDFLQNLPTYPGSIVSPSDLALPSC